MSIAMEQQNEILRLTEEPFKDEYELQGYLERCPYLLMTDSEPHVISIQREVQLPTAGTLDLLIVDENGYLIAVEVKLSGNIQSRREVIAQAFDYVSDLSQLTVDELDQLVDGALESALKEIAEKSTNKSNLWKLCGTYLRAGQVKIVIAVDKANEDLIRIVRYLNEHSDIDVRLVAISKFNNGKILVPNIIVSGEKSSASKFISQQKESPINPYFKRVIEAYNNSSPDELKTRGRAKNYRQIRFDVWPPEIHYEFLDYENEVGVELHLESDLIKPIGNIIKNYAGTVLKDSNLELTWDEGWYKGGRLLAKVSYTNTPKACADFMKELISLTSDTVNNELKKIET